MIIDCHGHYTTAPKGHDAFRAAQLKHFEDPSQPAPVYPDGFHFGFRVDEVATVEATHAALVRAGADVGAIDVNARGTMLYCRVDRLLVEVSCPKRR